MGSGVSLSGGQALGLIETRGLAPLIRALDAALKAAAVCLQGRRLVGGGLVNATVGGDVGAVKAALAAAEAVIKNLEAQGMTHVIARPDKAVWALLEQDGLKLSPEPEPPFAPAGPPEPQAAESQSPAPALRPQAPSPALRPQAASPAPRPESSAPVLRPQAPAPLAAEAPGEPKTRRPRPKSAAKTKKPRQGAKKKQS